MTSPLLLLLLHSSLCASWWSAALHQPKPEVPLEYPTELKGNLAKSRDLGNVDD